MTTQTSKFRLALTTIAFQATVGERRNDAADATLMIASRPLKNWASERVFHSLGVFDGSRW